MCSVPFGDGAWGRLIKVVTVITSGCKRPGWKSPGTRVESGENFHRRASNVTPSKKNAARGNGQRKGQQKQLSRLKFAVFQFQFKFTSMFHFI